MFRQFKSRTFWTPLFSCCWLSSFWRAVTKVLMSMEYQNFHSAQISIDGKIAYHSGGTGIHWSMTGVVSVAPYCLNFGLRLLFACRLTDPLFFEVDCISMLVKMAWLIFRVETTQRSRLLVSVRKNVVSRTHVHRHHKPRQRLLHTDTVWTTRGLAACTTTAQSLTPSRLPYHILSV